MLEGGPGHERISKASLVVIIADRISLVCSGQSVLMLSMSIFPGWMAGHDPPNPRGKGPMSDGTAPPMKNADLNAHAAF